MADGKIKISELDEALQLNNDAEFPYSQENGGVQTTYKAPIGQIARKVSESITYTNLTTNAKTLVGAINELKSLGSPILLGTTSPTAQQGANGNLYVQYTEGTGGADDEVDAIFVKIDGAWCEISTGGGGGAGGHTIVDDDGTSFTQRSNLQINGSYIEDNSTDDTTEVNVVRSMTKAAYNQLSADEKKGLINITDEASITGKEIPMSTADTDKVADRIEACETAISGKADTSTTYTKTEVDNMLGDKLDSAYLVKTNNGSFSALVKANTVWLIMVQRVSLNTSCVLLCHNYNNSVITKEIILDSGMAYVTNSQGTVSITYGGSGESVRGGAYRLY